MRRVKLLSKKLMAVTLLVALTMTGCASTGDAETTTETATESVVEAEDIVSAVNAELEAATEPAESEIYVEKVEGITTDFIRGADISTLLVQEASGVKYYDKDGNEADLLKVLAEAGVNYVRIRVWNDPYDAEGNGYGGGNNDIEKAIEIGKRATAYGMKVLVDFHYSDFWADPKKQFAPKAWEGMTVEEKTAALGTYTYDCVKALYDAGVNLGMVQVGNETDNGMAGETTWINLLPLYAAGCDNARKAASEAGKELLIAVHFSNPSKGTYPNIAKILANNEIDYDVFATSYYTYWHEDMETMTATMKEVAETYGKKVMVAETAYVYTLEDTDANGNSIGDEGSLIPGYTATVQGQANAVRDVAQAVADIGDSALGFFYWEPAWITVNPEGTMEENSIIWEEQGSGWASSYAADYDPNDAGQYYGGSAWDNQAMFDSTGHPLPSLDVFKNIITGATCEKALYEVTSPSLELMMGSEATMPETVTAVYNDGSTAEEAVTWNMNEVEDALAAGFGTYKITGALTSDNTPVTANLSVTAVNFVENESFEEDDTSMWSIINNASGECLWFDGETPKTGVKCAHFWSESALDFKLEQTVTGLENGVYNFNLNIQGGDMADAVIQLYAVADGQTYTAESIAVDGWKLWKLPELTGINVTNGEVTVGIMVQGPAKGWGTIDDACLYPAE